MRRSLKNLKITAALVVAGGEDAKAVTGERREMYSIVSWPIWSVVALFAVSLAYAQTNEIINYPVQVHQMLRHQITKVQAGSWTAWSEWSACTRQCGTGVTVQTRDCRAKPQGRHRRRSHTTTVRNHCIGLYKRIHICNTHMCAGNKDGRQEQCERYNGQLFLGRAYSWEPFLDAPNQCALNCRARGFRFYATLNNSVEDGTSCRGLITQPSATQWVCVSGMCQHVGCDGVVGSDKRLDTCGVCGGDNSTCRVISGLFTRPQLPVGYNLITQIPQTACNLTISELKQSRNYLALRRHDGTFVLNGNWAINWSGDYEAIGTKFTYHREDDHSTESIYSPGPLQEPLDLMVIYQQPNPGIKYQYQLPMIRTESVVYPPKNDAAIAPPLMRHSPGTNPVPDDLSSVKDNSIDGADHNKPLSFPYGNAVIGSETQGYSGDEAVKSRPKRKRKFAWKISGYTECTKSCGGGVQTSIILCVREHNQMTVPERRCAALEKPPAQTIRCNVKPCVAEWVPGEWSECSVTCGEGVQTREIICRQEITPTLIMTVAEGACLTPPSPLLHRARPCQRPPCPETLGSSGLSLGHSLHSSALLPGKWEVGAWSQCSVQCGLGVRTRTVSCPTGDCPLNDKPIFQAVCDMGSCSHSQAQSLHGHSHNWFYTEWSNQCSESCGTGVQTRKIHCSAGPDLDSQCDASSRPENSRACSSDKFCGGQWFSGPWGQCSASCGWGRHSRTVVCVAKVRGEMVLTSDNSCIGQDKPLAEQQCRLQPCGSEWYTADWSQCSRSCDTGLQRREVRCLDENQVISDLCSEESKPPTRRSCNTHRCPSTGGEFSGEQLQHQENQALPAAQPSQVDSRGSSTHEQAVHTEPVVSSDGTECVDKFRNCHLVVQARLCKYKYYRSSCCQACRNKV